MERCSNPILEQRSKSVNTALPALDGVISLVTHNRAMRVAALAAGTARFLVDSDPGRLRLRSAAATTLSLVIAIVAMLAFTRVAHQPVTVAMLGTIVAEKKNLCYSHPTDRIDPWTPIEGPATETGDVGRTTLGAS